MCTQSRNREFRALLAVCLVAQVAACTVPLQQELDVSSVSSEEAVKLLRKGEIKLVDTRSGPERSREISNALTIQVGPDRWTGELTNNDKQSFLTRIEASGLTRNDAIVVICNAGVRASAAARLLRASGYAKAKAVAGGYIGTNSDLGWQFFQDE